MDALKAMRITFRFLVIRNEKKQVTGEGRKILW